MAVAFVVIDAAFVAILVWAVDMYDPCVAVNTLSPATALATISY